ncbi:MAG: prepilin-type N-terminal cleavage/methylation domain-containing protein [Deltaproteobacteria bacterium]|nr:prepilin-type N-terminal cleavage/methylation domain-containing protein [Deltaproteobacteria bacterium]
MQRTQVAQYSRQETGFSLVEMMVALVILTVAVLGLLDLTITSIKTNVQNDIRSAAVRLTSQTAEVLLARPFSTTTTCGITLDTTITGYNSLYTYGTLNTCLVDTAAATDYQKYPYPQQRITGDAGATTVSGQIYNIVWTATSLSDTPNGLMQISILVSYKYRGQVYTNNVVIYKHE